MAYEEAALAVRAYPLFSPEGKFWTHALSSLCLAYFLTAEDSTSSLAWRLLLTWWSLELLIREVMELRQSGLRLWRVDVLNKLDLAASALTFLGQSLAVFLEWRKRGGGGRQLRTALQSSDGMRMDVQFAAETTVLSSWTRRPPRFRVLCSSHWRWPCS